MGSCMQAARVYAFGSGAGRHAGKVLPETVGTARQVAASQCIEGVVKVRQTKRVLEEIGVLNVETDAAIATKRARYNPDTVPLFCSICGKCRTEQDIPDDVVARVGLCECGTRR